MRCMIKSGTIDYQNGEFTLRSVLVSGHTSLDGFPKDGQHKSAYGRD